VVAERHATAAATQIVTLWSFRGKGPEGSKPELLSGLDGRCTGVAFLGEERVLACCDDGVLRLFARSGKWKLAASDDAQAPLFAMTVSGDARAALGSTKDGRLLCWNVG